MAVSSSVLVSAAGVYWVGTGGGAQIDKGGREWYWLCSLLASVSCTWPSCRPCSWLCRSGEMGMLSGLMGGSLVHPPPLSKAMTSCRTNWAVRGNWADTGDLNVLESLSLHSVTWMVGEPMESVLMGGDVVCEHGEGEVV